MLFRSGAGGAGAPSYPQDSTPGGDSSFATITATGGHKCVASSQTGGNNDDYSGATGNNAVCLHQGGGGAGAGGDAGIAGGHAKNNDGGIGIKTYIFNDSSTVGFGGGGAPASTGCGVGSRSVGDGADGGSARANSGARGWQGTTGAAGIVVVRYKYQ